jgi:transcriptional regulator with XRE-family HTH domain
MRRGRPTPPLILTTEEREFLTQWVQSRTTPRALLARAEIILDCSSGKTNAEVAADCGVSPEMVGRWRSRFLKHRLQGLADARGPRMKRKYTPEVAHDLIARTLETRPQDAPRWSTRSMAKAAGMSQTAISKIWRAFNVQPHRQRSLKLANDPRIAEHVCDVVGMLMNPPERALALSVNEKLRIDPPKPRPPLGPGHPERAAPKKTPASRAPLFAALDKRTTQVLSKHHRRRRAKDLLAFLKALDKKVAKDRAIHVNLDHGSTHKTKLVRKWLSAHPRFHLHLSSMGAAWLDLVDSFLADLTRKPKHRNARQSIRKLEAAIRAHVEPADAPPTSFTWV